MQSASLVFRRMRCILLRELGSPPQDNAARGGVRCLDHILAFRLEALGDGLTPRERNQTGEDHVAARFALDRVSADSQGLHPAFQQCPFVTAVHSPLFSG